jgi:glucuronoarabinoxylan endo-1,4-beta-xylanase
LNQAANSIGLDYVSVQNEPDWDPTCEGCGWTGAQLDSFCANNAPAIGRSVVMPEAVGFTDSFSDPTLNDGNAVGHITIVAGHFYGNGNYAHQNALNHGKHVWKTEHYYTGTHIGMCMNIAKEVSDAMNNQFSAYFWWWIMPNDGATIINGSTPLKNGYTLGQFAHWVRPGMVRVGTTYSPQSGVYVTAYKSPLRIVVVNTTGNWLGQTFTIQNGSVSYLQPFRTSAADL